MLLMEEILHQLIGSFPSIYNFPIIYKFLYITGGAGFFPSTVGWALDEFLSTKELRCSMVVVFLFANPYWKNNTETNSKRSWKLMVRKMTFPFGEFA